MLKMTISLPPPTLELLGQQRGENYSKYKANFRKFVARCLQKDPSKRDSATELLRCDFIKKQSKDKQFLIRELLERIPSASDRRAANEEAARVPPKSVMSARFTITAPAWDFGSLVQPLNHSASSETMGSGLEEIREQLPGSPRTVVSSGSVGGGSMGSKSGSPLPPAAAQQQPGSATAQGQIAPGVYSLKLRVRQLVSQKLIEARFKLNIPEGRWRGSHTPVSPIPPPQPFQPPHLANSNPDPQHPARVCSRTPRLSSGS